MTDRQITSAKGLFPSSASTFAACAQTILAGCLSHRFYPTISIRDILFCVLFPAYLLLANHLRFANNIAVRTRPKDHPHSASAILSEFFTGTHTVWFQAYMLLAAVIGLILPLAVILRCPKREVADLAVPHTFLLWCQIIFEQAVMFNPRAHRYVAIVGILVFGAYRTSSALDWFLSSALLYGQFASRGEVVVPDAHFWGLVLSGLNLALNAHGLLVVMLLRVVPEYLSDDRCESPNARGICHPFVKEPTKPTYEKKMSG